MGMNTALRLMQDYLLGCGCRTASALLPEYHHYHVELKSTLNIPMALPLHRILSLLLPTLAANLSAY